MGFQVALAVLRSEYSRISLIRTNSDEGSVGFPSLSKKSTILPRFHFTKIYYHVGGTSEELRALFSASRIIIREDRSSCEPEDRRNETERSK